MNRDQTRQASRAMDVLAIVLALATILIAVAPVLLASRNLDCRYASATAKAIMLCPGR